MVMGETPAALATSRMVAGLVRRGAWPGCLGGGGRPRRRLLRPAPWAGRSPARFDPKDFIGPALP